MKRIEHYAVLDTKGSVIRCGPQRHNTWFTPGAGFSLKPIKQNLIGNFLVETRFNSHLRELEGIEPCFWQVVLSNPPIPSRGDFPGALTNTISPVFARDAETIREALKQEPPIKHELSFLRSARGRHRTSPTAPQGAQEAQTAEQ
jgi:hypothetical protein